MSRVLTLLIACCWLVCSHAAADTSAERARALFREARQLSANGYFEAACAKFEQSLKFEPGMGTEFNLADCYERMGRTASARDLFLGVAAAAAEQDLLERERVANERADSLLLRLSRLRVQCERECPARIEVLREEHPLVASTWNEPVAVDPGVFRVRATYANNTTWSTLVQVPRDPGTVVVSVPATTATEGEAPSPRPLVTRGSKAKSQPGGNARRSAPLPPRREGRAPIGVLPRVMLWVSAGGLAAAGISAVVLHGKNDKASAICPTSESCTSTEIKQHEELVQDAKLARVGVYSGLTLGVAALSTAALSQFVFGTARDERRPVGLKVRIVPGAGTQAAYIGASATGSW